MKMPKTVDKSTWSGAGALMKRLRDHDQKPMALFVLVNNLGVHRDHVADEIGVSAAQISNYLNGNAVLPERRWNLLMRALAREIAGAEAQLDEAVAERKRRKHSEVWDARVVEARASIELAKAVWGQEMGFTIYDSENSPFPGALQAAQKTGRRKSGKSQPKRPNP